MFLHLCVILFTQGVCIQVGSTSGGGSASKGGCTQGGLASVGLGRFPHQILQDMVDKRAVRILLECILVFNLGLNANFLYVLIITRMLSFEFFLRSLCQFCQNCIRANKFSINVTSYRD